MSVTVSGGIHLKGNLHGTPALNTLLLAVGAGLASFMGATGASMLLVRPLIRANDNRRHRAHVFVFFIFIVSNVGAIRLPDLLRDVGLLAITFLSFRATPSAVHAANQFSWAPMVEVAKLFAGIFVTIVPVIAMLRAGEQGAFSSVVSAVTRGDGSPDPWMYFWISGLLSSFLDNAPTYLVFFNVAGGDPQGLMTTLAPTLVAISAGSVFMGANSYIGNAPNLMVRAIVEERGVRMPSFFGYMAWSGAVLIPLFIGVSLIWIR